MKDNHTKYVIYKITSKINSKFYVGSAIDFEVRKKQHIYKLKNGIHCNKKLQNHVNKYGIDDLKFDIIEISMFSELLRQTEQYYIDNLMPEFNLAKTVTGCVSEIEYKKFLVGINNLMRGKLDEVALTNKTSRNDIIRIACDYLLKNKKKFNLK